MKTNPTSLVLLNIVDDMFMNVSGKEAIAIIHQLIKMLTADDVWLLKHISQDDALLLINVLELFALTGKRQTYEQAVKKN